jgi:hypothetical protein
MSSLFKSCILYASTDTDSININLYYNIIQDQTPNKQRIPAYHVNLTIYGHKLNIKPQFEGYELQLLQNDDVVYSEMLMPNVLQVQLPESFIGEYELRLVDGNQYYYGYISW